MNKYLLRTVYNLIKAKRLKVALIQALDRLNIPVYRLAIDTNNSCNLRCIMCYMSLDEYRQKIDIMPVDMFESIAKQIFGKTRVLDLSCGFEPFMTRDFLSYLRIARKYCRGFISICTNALLLNEETIEAICGEQLLDELIISVDGIKESTYHSIRINGDFNKLISNLKILKEKKGNASKPVVRLNYTMLRQNIDELPGIYEFVKKYDINAVQLRHAKLMAPFNDLFNESLFYYQDLYDEVMREIIPQFHKDNHIKLIHPPLFSDKNPIVADKSQCAYPWFYFIISSDGNVKMCHSGYIGNIGQSCFSDMISSDFVKRTRGLLLKGRHEEICGGCHNISDIGSTKAKEYYIQSERYCSPYS
ncbi:MAG: radical SAM protein [Nitrospirae bacterium]|nr:radical SAM protein [Nitrospirota bacterium]